MELIEQLYHIYRKYNRIFTDSRQSAAGGIFFALKGDNFNGNDFVLEALKNGAEYAVSDNENLPSDDRLFKVGDVLQTLQLLANYHRRQLKIPVLAVTGTNGKTTTKELITATLSEKYNVLSTKGNFNNHIGVPLTLLSIKPEHEIAVIEMGANHPGEIKFLCNIAEPDFGIITNVGRAHLEGFGSFEGVKKTKGELYEYISRKGKGIFINSGNEHLMAMAPGDIEKFTYSVTDHSAQLIGESVNDDLKLVCKILFPRGWLYVKTNLTGNYNLENVLAASRIGIFFGVDPLDIQRGIEKYVPSNNRSQILNIGHSTIIVDCYNANPSSMEASIRNFIQVERQNKTLILGDMLELGADSEREHQKIADVVAGSGIDDVYWVGTHFMKVNFQHEAKRFETVDNLLAALPLGMLENRFILIKGSRGIRLEKIVDWLK